MPEPIESLEPARVRANLERVRDRAGAGVEVLIATKYVPVEGMGALAEAGVELVGENRLQDLREKQEQWGDAFRWDFIGALQSRKVRQLLPHCSRIHSLATDSALAKLEAAEPPLPEILIQVDVAGEESKAGFQPSEVAGAIDRCAAPVSGLMTMPPLAEDPEDSRRHFAALAELAAEHGLSQLSMGTSQDWEVAVEEGATVIRLGTSVLR